MPVFEFECPRGHITSEMVPWGRIRIRCNELTRKPPWRCNLWASKIISATPGIVKDPAVPRSTK
jgi:hypothetical protein